LATPGITWQDKCFHKFKTLSFPRKKEYSQHQKTGPSGIQMVIFCTIFGSGFQMALAAILLKPFENRTKKSGFQMAKTK
jgi:hypothetical protein